MMDTNAIIGLDSAYLCAQETGSGNMQISAGLVVELIDRLRAAETECQELRHAQNSLFDRLSDLTAYKEAAENQKPHRIIISDGFTEQLVKQLSSADEKAAKRFNWEVKPLYAKPVPADKPESMIDGQEDVDLESLTDQLHELIVKTPMGESPLWSAIYELIEKHVSGRMV